LTLFFCLNREYSCMFFFFFNDTATTEIYTLSLHDALPISASATGGSDFADQGRGALDQSGSTDRANREDSDSEGQDDSGSF